MEEEYYCICDNDSFRISTDTITCDACWAVYPLANPILSPAEFNQKIKDGTIKKLKGFREGTE